MSEQGLASVTEAQLVHDVVSQHELPPDTDSVTFEFGIDHNGDPAVWLIFCLAPGREATPGTYEALYDFAHIIRPELLVAGIERWPYVRLRSTSADRLHEPSS